jgi:inosose dehydratase
VSSVSRRQFVKTLGGAAASMLPMVRTSRGATARITFGYASITWAGKDLQAIDDIAAAGYRGIQLRSNVLAQFGDRPAELRQLLERRRLQLAAFSSGAVRIDPAAEQRVIDDHVAHARFVRDIGGTFLQLTDERPAGRAVSADDCVRLGSLLTEIGRRSADIGVVAAYHPHMGTIGETPENTARVLAAADPRYVKLLLDVAHYTQGGGDPALAIRQHRDRLALLHLKDVESPRPGGAPGSYRFVELGRGNVDLGAVFAALDEISFTGWGIVELDDVTDPSRSARESALLSKRYLEKTGFVI